MKITVYSTKTCPYCTMLKRYLNDKKIEYTNVMVDEDMVAARRMVELSGQMGVPFTTIENNETTTKILGFDVPRLEAALNVKKVLL